MTIYTYQAVQASQRLSNAKRELRQLQIAKRNNTNESPAIVAYHAAYEANLMKEIKELKG